MLGKNDYVYCDELGKFIGTYVYYTYPQQHIQFDVTKGVGIDEASKAAINLANILHTDVKMPFNKITLVIPHNQHTKTQHIINKYLKEINSTQKG